MSDQKHQVGDTVYCDFSYYSRIIVKAGVVVKVTPTGRVNVDFGDGKASIEQFDKQGRQIGGARFHWHCLIDHETYERLSKKQKQQQAWMAINRHVGAAKYNDRAQLDAFIEKLVELAAAVEYDQ